MTKKEKIIIKKIVSNPDLLENIYYKWDQRIYNHQKTYLNTRICRKKVLNPRILKQVAVETMYNSYPHDEWPEVFNDGLSNKKNCKYSWWNILQTF